MPQPKREGRNEAEWTPEDFTASRNLLKIWLQKKKALKLTQNKLARLWEMSQGSVSRYINGILRLNTETVLRFAVVLDVPPEHIDPRIVQLMRTRKVNYTFSISIQTTEYEPRIMLGDKVNLDLTTTPRNGQLAVAYQGLELIIGYYKDNALIHPISQIPQAVPNGYTTHRVDSIAPKETL